MALTFIPSDLIEQAAREENWTDSDRQHCSSMLRQAFEESFQVQEIQRSVNGLIAYDSPFVSFESARFPEGAVAKRARPGLVRPGAEERASSVGSAPYRSVSR